MNTGPVAERLVGARLLMRLVPPVVSQHALAGCEHVPRSARVAGCASLSQSRSQTNDLGRPVDFVSLGQTRCMLVGETLHHAAVHGVHHRGQVALLIRHFGVHARQLRLGDLFRSCRLLARSVIRSSLYCLYEVRRSRLPNAHMPSAADVRSQAKNGANASCYRQRRSHSSADMSISRSAPS
jgi:hypothetical protein